jgi:anti-anti-sigma regulatory factor
MTWVLIKFCEMTMRINILYLRDFHNLIIFTPINRFQIMNVKTDTKERFTVLKPMDSDITAEKTSELQRILTELLKLENPNLVVNFDEVENTCPELVQMLIEMHEKFYQDDHSFVICGVPDSLMEKLTELEMEDVLNVTPTESEAWDIVQMEEIERELLNGED